MNDEIETRRSVYRFGPLERRGILGSIRLGQALTLALGATASIVILDQSPTAAGAILSTAVFGASVLVALVPLGRRTVEEWIPILLSFTFRGTIGARHFKSRAPTSGARAAKNGSRPGRRSSLDLPSALRTVRIFDAGYGAHPIGVLSENGGRRLTAVLACRVVAFSLLDADAQERRLNRWGVVLSGAASSAIRRIQWIERTAPAQADDLVRWLHDERDPGIPLRGTPMIESYLELISGTAKITQEHEILLAVQVDSARVHERGEGAVTQALLEEAERVAQGLTAAEVTVLGALTSGQLARALRTAFDPYARTELAALQTADPDRDGLEESGAWPVGAHEGWEHYRTDGAVHSTYWISGWPRVDVSPLFMDALLGRSASVRAVSVTFEPVAPERSMREVEAAVTRDHADRELRQRFGQSETARQRQAQESTMRREAELAAGHNEVRLAGFVTVSGRDLDELRRACVEVQDQAARARLELHRMYGQQAQAFTFTLPLCRGLR